MCWLVSQFGQERLLNGKVILPTEEFFPAPYDHSEDGARILLDQVCRYMDVDPASVDLLFYSERQPVALNIEVVRPDGGTAGLYREQNGRTTISLEVSRLADPISVVATFAHELCHAHLLGGGRISRKEEDHEPLTDLATVYFGMGIFIANATLRDKSYHLGNWEGWIISRQGYLTAPILAYALALFAWLRRETQPEWAGSLRLDVRSPFRKALSYLAHTEGAVLLPPETQDAGSPACPADLSARLGLRPQHNRADAANLPDVSADTPADSQFTKAVVLMQQGQWEEAVRLLSEVLMHDPRDGEAYQQRALAYLGLGKWKEALTDAEQAVRSSPDDSESFRVRGMAYLDSQQWARAVADFTRYLEAEDVTAADPARVSRVYYSRGTAYAKDGELSRAIADFTKAIRRWPQWPAPYEARACAYERLGKTKKALADREEAAQRAKSLGKHESAPELRTSIIHPPGMG
jgi:tetratricopeptide (TPR) repeat protein